jgi:hypothetical protein
MEFGKCHLLDTEDSCNHAHTSHASSPLLLLLLLVLAVQPFRYPAPSPSHAQLVAGSTSVLIPYKVHRVSTNKDIDDDILTHTKT